MILPNSLIETDRQSYNASLSQFIHVNESRILKSFPYLYEYRLYGIYINRYGFLNRLMHFNLRTQYRSLLSPAKCVNEEGTQLIVLAIKTMINAVERRNAIRATWGNEHLWNYDMSRLQILGTKKVTMKLIFLVGLSTDDSILPLSEEHAAYKDILLVRVSNPSLSQRVNIVLLSHFYLHLIWFFIGRFSRFISKSDTKRPLAAKFYQT